METEALHHDEAEMEAMIHRMSRAIVHFEAVKKMVVDHVTKDSYVQVFTFNKQN